MLDEYIEWDINEEKEKNKQNAEKILKDFPDVKGLKEVLDNVQSLMDSEVYNKVYVTSIKGHEEGLSTDKYAENLLEFPQVKKAASVLKNPPLYLPPLTDVITSITFISTMHVLIWVYYTYIQKDLSHDDVLKIHTIILGRIMSSLDNFNTVKEYNAPDEEFYKKLKQIKWDKTGKKLFKKIFGIRDHIALVRWGSDSSTFNTGENFALTFLAACNAVHHNRDKILPEDVILAYKTYLKLLNTDISKLDV